jgi:hypothetical protein
VAEALALHAMEFGKEMGFYDTLSYKVMLCRLSLQSKWREKFGVDLDILWSESKRIWVTYGLGELII